MGRPATCRQSKARPGQRTDVQADIPPWAHLYEMMGDPAGSLLGPDHRHSEQVRNRARCRQPYFLPLAHLQPNVPRAPMGDSTCSEMHGRRTEKKKRYASGRGVGR